MIHSSPSFYFSRRLHLRLSILTPLAAGHQSSKLSVLHAHRLHFTGMVKSRQSSKRHLTNYRHSSFDYLHCFGTFNTFNIKVGFINVWGSFKVKLFIESPLQKRAAPPCFDIFPCGLKRVRLSWFEAFQIRTCRRIPRYEA